MNNKLNSLTIFFPAYNEAKNIESVLNDALKYAPKVAKVFEILVVDDGSTDATSEKVLALAKKFKHIRLIKHAVNKGYGSAVKTGLKSAKYEWIFFTDSDGQFSFSELPHFVSLQNKADVIVGRRLKRRDPILRIILAQFLLKYWNFLFFGLWMKDVDCAYKLIPAKFIGKINLITESAITVTELMVRLKKMGATIYETPITHYPRKHGLQTGSNPKVIYRAFIESFKLWETLNQTK